ncbi:MAG: peptide chain release factor N(5)-glutamine methyltransferase [Planctomycetota bacterium]|nr:peptide chain release factor N(5)-glutamine methyltransferase [Planctomycetota bacterium]
MTSTSTTQSDPWTILRLLQWTTEHLKKNGSPSPRLDAEVLLAHARGCERIALYTAFAEEPDEPVKARFREVVKRRAQGEPVAYLVGKKEFYSLSFNVSKDCLIPRGETEHIVVECLDHAKPILAGEPTKQFNIVDVCTGSGCIAVSVAKHLSQCSITAIDLSPAAVAIAKNNVEMHKLSDRISVIESDLLTAIPDNSVDFVLTNPPYVSEAEYAALDKTVREHEPRIALVGGVLGTEIIEKLAAQAAQKLVENGWFICELSPMIADQVESHMASTNHWVNITIVKDLARLKRLVVAQRNPV